MSTLTITNAQLDSLTEQIGQRIAKDIAVSLRESLERETEAEQRDAAARSIIGKIRATEEAFESAFPPLRVKMLSIDAQIPLRAHASDAGYDICTIEDITLQAEERKTVSTGVAVAIPEGYVGLMCPRSGLASKQGLTIVNAPGVIDSGYRGELMVILLNTSHDVIEFKKGDRIAQLVLVPFAAPLVRVVGTLEDTDRGENGGGSTGV
jgi:dUTP pyrophosphatase